MDLRSFIRDDERALKLAHIRHVHAEVSLQRQLHMYALRDINEGTAGPDSTVQRGKFVIVIRHHRAEIFTEQFRIEAQPVFNADEDHALFFQLFLNGVVYHLGFVLCSDTGEELLFGFRDAKLVEGVFDGFRDIVPAFF